MLADDRDFSNPRSPAVSSPAAKTLPTSILHLPGELAEQVLSHSQSGRDVAQEFVPLAESLECELGQQYLRERGNNAFISDSSPVPFVINKNSVVQDRMRDCKETHDSAP